MNLLIHNSSSIGVAVQLLAALFKNSIGMGWFAPTRMDATGLAAFNETQWLFFSNIPTNICEKELETGPRTGFALSTCTEVEKKIQTDRRWRNYLFLRLTEFRSRDVSSSQNTRESPDTSLLASCGCSNSETLCEMHQKLPATPEFVASVASRRTHYNQRIVFSILLSVVRDAVLFVFSSRLSCLVHLASEQCYRFIRRNFSPLCLLAWCFCISITCC